MTLDERKIDEKKLAAIRNYEDKLIGQTSSFNKKELTEIMREEELVKYWWNYALKTLCRFDCDQALDYCDDKLVKMLYLDNTLSMFKNKSHNAKDNYSFVISMIYPEDFKYSKTAQVIDEFEHANHIGRYAGIDDNYVFSKKFFSGPEGNINTSICLTYCITNFLNYKSELEIYEFFASNESEKFLKKYKFPSRKKRMASDNLEYFYQHLSDDKKNQLYYNLIRFNKEHNL